MQACNLKALPVCAWTWMKLPSLGHSFLKDLTLQGCEVTNFESICGDGNGKAG